MAGGTTFHFVQDGIEVTIEQAFDAADGKDVRIGGDASIVQQYLRAGLIDDLHIAIVPILLGVPVSGSSTTSTVDQRATTASSPSARPLLRMSAFPAQRK